MELDSSQKRDSNLDCLRGVAILLITVFHAWRFIGSPVKPFFFFWDYYAPFRKGLMGVPIFVFISGYSMFLSDQHNENTFAFLKRRAIKLLPRYYLAIIIWNLLILMNLYDDTCTLKDNLFHFLLIHTFFKSTFYSISDPLWYLGIQSQLYIIYAFIRLRLKHNLYLIFLLAFLIMFATNIFITADVYSGSTINLMQRSILSYFFIFVFGYMYSKYLKKTKYSLINITILIVSTITIFFNQYIVDAGRIGLFLESLLLSVAIMGIPSNICESRYALFFRYIGKYSYPIFLYNFIFMIIPIKLYGLLGISIYVTFTFIFSIIFEKLFIKCSQYFDSYHSTFYI